MHQSNPLNGRSHQDNLLCGMLRHNKTMPLLLGIIILFFTTVCFAGERRLEAIYINADEMHFDLQSNTSVYKGNVSIRQGTIELSGDNVEIKQTDNAISRIIASGNPARFRQTGSDGNNMHAQSKLIKYFADEDRLVMIDDAKLVQNEQVIESSHISYDTKEQALLAGQKSEEPDAQQRVKMTLTPNTKQ